MMKKEILDTPFRDSFSDFLEKGETILWQGQSAKFIPSIYDRQEDGSKKLSPIKFIFNIYDTIENSLLITLFVSLIIIQIYLGKMIWDVNLYLGLAFILFLGMWFRYYKKRTNQYAITEKRILFQLAKLPKDDIQEIRFEDIKDCIITKDSEYYGVIFLAMKNPKTVPDKLFEKERHSPTLERIEDTEEVTRLVRQGIKNANTLL